MNAPKEPQEQPSPAPRRTSQSVDWYSEGQTRTVDVAGVQITVRFVGRRGRKGRIAIEAPPGAVFQERKRRST